MFQGEAFEGDGMSELRAKYLHQVLIIRDGSTSDGMYGLVTQIIEGSETPLTVTFWLTQGVRHENYYAAADVELTTQAWNEFLTRDSELRCVYDKHFTHLYYVCDKSGRDINGYGTPGLAWAHWFEEHDEATVALRQLTQEATVDKSTESMENKSTRDPDGRGKEHEDLAGKLEDLGERRRVSE
jgi:hypothetical protein